MLGAEQNPDRRSDLVIVDNPTSPHGAEMGRVAARLAPGRVVFLVPGLDLPVRLRDVGGVGAVAVPFGIAIIDQAKVGHIERAYEGADGGWLFDRSGPMWKTYAHEHWGHHQEFMEDLRNGPTHGVSNVREYLWFGWGPGFD